MEPNRCTICMEDIVGAGMPSVQLVCEHVYHAGCIHGWFRFSNNRSCPNCRNSEAGLHLPVAPAANNDSRQPLPGAEEATMRAFQERGWVETGASTSTQASEVMIMTEGFTQRIGNAHLRRRRGQGGGRGFGGRQG